MCRCGACAAALLLRVTASNILFYEFCDLIAAVGCLDGFSQKGNRGYVYHIGIAYSTGGLRGCGQRAKAGETREHLLTALHANAKSSNLLFAFLFHFHVLSRLCWLLPF